VKLAVTVEMDNAGAAQTAGTTSDFVVDLLSGAQMQSISTRSDVPPKPAPRKRNRRPKEAPQVAENYTASGGGGRSTIKQTLPPDEDALLVNTCPVPAARLAESVVSDKPESRQVSDSRVIFTSGDVDDFQSYEYKGEPTAKPYVMSPASENFDRVHLLSVSSSVSGGEELLLASVPNHTLRIEPSPALTLDTRKHHSLRTNGDRSDSGRLKSSGSVSDDLDNLQEMSFGEPTRSSSTPVLIGDGMYNDDLRFWHDKLDASTADSESCVIKAGRFDEK